MDRFTAMSAFVRVVEAGSFTKASETLDLPKPTVTRLVQGLERDLRVRLLDRTTRSVTVTAEGAAYYDRVVRLLAELSDIESTAKQTLAKPSGRLHVDVATAIATDVLIPALPDFYRAYPDIELEFSIINRHTDLVAENVDCVIRAGFVDEQSLVARRIGEFRLTTCASPKYLSSFGTPGAPADLEGEHRMLGLISNRTGKPIPFRFIKGEDSMRMSPHARFCVNDVYAHLAAGIAGVGVLQSPAFMLPSVLASGQLVPVLQDWDTATIPVHAIYRPNRFLGAKVRIFIDWAIALFERHPHLKLD